MDTQLDQLEEDLQHIYGDDEEDEDLRNEFQKWFKCAFVSSTAKKDAYIKMQKLKIKNNQLDEYIAEQSTLIAELDWNADSEMLCHSFREGLLDPLARKVIDMEGIPESLTQWIRYSQKYHSQWAITQALGYIGKKNLSNTSKPRWNPKEKKKERGLDAIDVDFAQITPDKKE